ncbi:hypothetical protein BBJ28_00006966 [Nothophytophthora sp. Chile5]|nr:hypothetical protein BBJ28_00006966 [Nothophytophthora sp. Chile5]
MEEWVRAKVVLLGLDADVYVEYGKGLLEDEDMAVEERVQSVAGVFTGAADGLVADDVIAATLDEANMVADVTRILAATTAQHEQEEELRRAEHKLRDLEIREKQKKEAEEGAEREREKAQARQKMSREELAAREKLISEYGFSVVSDFDEDGNVVKIQDKVEGDPGPSKKSWCQAQNSMREKLKKEHEKKVKHEKELLEKDRARKDKAKKRTVKREKQRGCG